MGLNKHSNKLSTGNYVGQSRSQYRSSGLIFTRCFFPQAFNSEWHKHENSHLTFCLKGGSIERRKKENILCSPGLLLFYPADELHRNTDYVSNSESFSIEFENKWCKNFEISNQQSRKDNIITDPLIKHQIVRIMREVKERDDQSGLNLEAILLKLLSNLNKDKISDKKPLWVSVLYDLLHDEYNNCWNLNDLSKKINVHPVTISKYFPKYFHSNIGDYIRKIRTERSLIDLSRKSMAIEEIATKYGFVDNAHYTRVFKNHTGLTPSQYRKYISG